MRNLLEHPITTEEIRSNLLTLADELSSLNLCGDMRPMLLREAADRIKPESEHFTNTPLGVAQMYEYKARRTGRTTFLVDSIPEQPISIVTHSGAMSDCILNLLKQRRPEYNINNITFVVWDLNAGQRLAGLKRPVYFENAVLDIESIKLVKDVNRVYGPKGTRYEIP